MKPFYITHITIILWTASISSNVNNEYQICSAPRALIDLNEKRNKVKFIDNVTFNFLRKVNRNVEIDSMRFNSGATGVLSSRGWN